MHDHQDTSGNNPEHQQQQNEAPSLAIPDAPFRVRREGEDGEIDPALSNTGSNKYKGNDKESNEEWFKPLRWGVDSLYLSFTGELFSHQETELDQLKQLAQSNIISDQASAQMEIHGHIFEVKDKGAGLFPYILEDNCFRIQLSRHTSKSMPMAYVKISSDYLTHKPVLETVDDLRKVLNELGVVDYMPKVSRIDLFVDFVSSFDIEGWGRQAWVTRANSINQYSVGGVFSGWAIGFGGVIASRLYDKLLELLNSQKNYLIPLWQAAGWDSQNDGHVWRQEFQFKRDILGQFNIQALNQTLSNLNGLWCYATTDWLKLTIPTDDDQNRSRWPIHPLWAYLASVDFESDGGPLSRTFSPARVPSDKRLFDHAFSSLSSFMAREGMTDFYLGMEAFRLRMYHHLNNKAMDQGIYFDTYIKDCIALKAKRFNSILNKLEPDPLDDADEYRKQSDGE